MSKDKVGKLSSIEEVSNQVFSGLTKEQIKFLLDPTGVSKGAISIPFHVKGNDDQLTDLTLWLTVSQKRTCWYIRAKHEYEAYVTSDSESGPRYSIDKIELHIKRGKDSADYVHTCTNTSWCPKTDEITGYGGMCDWSKVMATGTHWGQSWSTDWSSL